jgi:hypothetical protein
MPIASSDLQSGMSPVLCVEIVRIGLRQGGGTECVTQPVLPVITLNCKCDGVVPSGNFVASASVTMDQQEVPYAGQDFP